MRPLHRFKLSSFQVILLGFAAVILIGAFLLMLPISSKDGIVTPFSDALFTSTSAVCVTGLIVQDTATYWSYFGQAVILILIQIGGLGVVTVAASVSILAGRKIGLGQRSTMQEAMSAPSVGGIVRLTWFILKGVLIVEIIGMLAMMPVFYTMSILSDITDSIDKNNPDDNQNAIYCTIDWLSDNIVEPYEKSFVYEIYKSMALVDLMNATVRIGTRVQLGEETHYVDDIVRGVITNTVTVVTNLISARPNPQAFGKALNGILTQPFLLSTLTGFITDMMADVEITEPEEGDILGSITNTILAHYKYADSSVIEEDMSAITDMLVYLVDQGFLFAIASGELGFEEVLTDKDNIKGLLGTMSGLSVYDIVMSGAFELAVNTMGPMLGSPMNNVVGYTSFVDKIGNHLLEHKQSFHLLENMDYYDLPSKLNHKPNPLVVMYFLQLL